MSFIEDRYFYKDLTREIARKRIEWAFLVVLLVCLIMYFIGPRLVPGEMAIFTLLFIFIFGFWPMLRVCCPKCGNKNWFTIGNRMGVIYARIFFDPNYTCPKCGYKFK